MKALFLDRDGTLIEDTHYLHKPEEVKLIPRVQEALKTALEKEYQLFLFTNQSGIGRGYYTLEDTIACNEEMTRQLNLGPNLFKDICIAPEAPEQPQNYRKPSPKFILEMISQHNLDASKSWMIGDRLSDLEAGKSGKVQPAFVETGKPLNEETRNYIQQNSIPVFKDFFDLVETLD